MPMNRPLTLLIVGLVAGATLLSACATSDTSSSPATSASRAAAPSGAVEPAPAAPVVDEEGALSPTGEPVNDVLRTRPAIQAFGVINDLAVAIKIDVSDVDPYDWVLDDAGRPDDRIPRGFAGVVKAGTRTFAAFHPNKKANGAPFKLDVNAWTPANVSTNDDANPVTAAKPIGSASFDKIFICTIKGLPVPCNFLASEEWMGWGFRVANPGGLENQYFSMCGRIRDLGSYTFNNETRQARVRIACGLNVDGRYANAAIVEDVPQ